MNIRAYNIEYDIDEPNSVSELPTEIYFENVEKCFPIQDELAGMISDRTGYCINGCEYQILDNPFD